MSNPVVITVAPAAVDDDGIAQSQTPAGAGNLTINGALATGGVATIGSNANGGTLRVVLLTFAADETGHTFVVYGTNAAGTAISQSIAGTGIGTVASTIGFYTVTRVSISAAATGAIKVGTVATVSSGMTPWQLVNYQIVPVNLGIAIVVTGTINYTWEYTYDDFLDLTNYPVPTVFSISALAAEATTLDSGILTPAIGPIRGWRLKINSYSTGATATVTVIQAGIRNF